jgi:hypothetical protein
MTPDGLKFDHEIDFRNPDRGAMFAAYVVWKHAGKFSGVIMTKLEIDGIRKRSKSPDKGPWQTDYSEMAKKTVVHRASKLWPLDAIFKEAIEVQEAKESTLDLAPLPAITDDSELKTITAPPDEVPMDGKPPLAETISVSEPLPKEETTSQATKRIIIQGGVPFEMFTVELNARNISAEAVTSSWPDYEAVTEQVWTTLGLQQKTLAAIIKKWGKNK